MRRIAVQIFALSLLITSPALAIEDKQKFSEAEIVQSVIERNSDLKTAGIQIGISEAELIQSGKVDNLSIIEEVQSFDPSKIQNNDNFQLNIGVSYEFLLNNQVNLRKDIARFGINNARLELQNLIRERVLNAKQSYDELLYRYRIIELKKIHLHHATEIYDVTEKQFQAGEIAKYEVYRTELEKSNASRLLDAATREVILAQTQLNYLLNRKTGNVIPTDHFILPEIKNLKLDTLINSAITNNPELMILDSRVKAEEIRLKLARADIFPSLSTELLIGNQGLSGRVQFPLPLLYKQEGEIAVSQATNNFLTQQYKSKQQQIISEVTKAYQQVILSIEAIKSFENVVLNQSKNLQILALKRLRAGEGSILEVLEAEHTQHENDDEYARLVLEARKNYHYLEYVIGGKLVG